jgi:hypothetical protein
MLALPFNLVFRVFFRALLVNLSYE